MAKRNKASKRMQKLLPRPVRRFLKQQGAGAVLGFVSGFVADTAVEYVTRLEQRRQNQRHERELRERQPDEQAELAAGI